MSLFCFVMVALVEKNISTLESLRDRKSLHVVHLASNYTKLTYQIWLKIAFYP